MLIIFYQKKISSIPILPSHIIFFKGNYCTIVFYRVINLGRIVHANVCKLKREKAT